MWLSAVQSDNPEWQWDTEKGASAQPGEARECCRDQPRGWMWRSGCDLAEHGGWGRRALLARKVWELSVCLERMRGSVAGAGMSGHVGACGCYWPGLLASLINSNGSEAGQEIQVSFDWIPCCSRGEWEQRAGSLALLLSEGEQAAAF